jgi:hypothetical protein
LAKNLPNAQGLPHRYDQSDTDFVPGKGHSFAFGHFWWLKQHESLMHRHDCILDRVPIMMKVMQETRRANSAHRRDVARFHRKLKAEAEEGNYKILTQLIANEFAKAKQ